jgi:phosphoglycerate kinase
VVLRSVRELDASGKRVFVRVDLNVPLRNGVVADDTRIRAALPTIELLLAQGARVILASHLGRPHGAVDAHLRMTPVASRLTRLLGHAVGVASDCIGPDVARAVELMEPGQVLLLENLRFHPGEEADDPAFAAALAANADAYVDDAFGAAHRAHASTVGIAKLLPAYAGLLMEREVTALSGLLETPAHPFVAILGGAKVSDKLGVIRQLLTRVDALVLGGGMANTFLLAEGLPIGRSLAERELVEEAGRLLGLSAARGVPIITPLDVVVADEVRAGALYRVAAVNEVEPDETIVDIGPGSVRSMRTLLEAARTIFWNGPLGVFEIDDFAAGTDAVARELAGCAIRGASVIAGGGDSLAAIRHLDIGHRFTHLSTGGGASLEFLEGRELPGVRVLRALTAAA